MAEDPNEYKIHKIIEVAIQKELKSLFLTFFNINIEDGHDRARFSNMINSLNKLPDREADLTFLHELKERKKENEKEVRKTVWDTIRGIITPVVVSVGAALFTWLLMRH